MPRYNLINADSQNYYVEFPDSTSGQTSSYFFAFVKSGSSLMDNMLSTYCSSVGVAYFSLFGQIFAQGLNTLSIGEEAQILFKHKGYVYSGFRHYPQFMLPIMNEPVAMLVRDPRDMLVSFYFSVTKSHVIPTGNESLKADREQAASLSIDDFVLKRAFWYLKEFNRYRKHLADKRVSTFFYEEIVFNKESWLRQMINLAQLPINKTQIRSVASQFDVIPESEQESEHIRQVHPGNHRKKLKPETIEKLNDILAPFLKTYNYL